MRGPDARAGDTGTREVERLRHELEETRARFHNTVERIADGIVVLDPDRVVTFANPAANELFGRDGAGLIGSEFGHPVVPGETAEIDLVRPDGKRRVAELRVVRTRWDEEDSLLVSLRDITDRKEAEEKARALVREQAARAEAEAAAERERFLADAGRRLGEHLDFEEIVSTAADLAVEGIADYAVLDVRRAEGGGALRRRTAARSDGPCPPLDALAERTLDPEGESETAGVLRSGESVVLSAVDPETLRRGWGPEDGENVGRLDPVAAVLVPLGSREGGPIGVLTLLFCDEEVEVGETQVRLAEELGHRAAQAIQNARLLQMARRANRSKSDFLAVVSHELRTPLTAITGYAGLLTEGIGGELEEAQRGYVEGIERSADQLLRLIDEIIAFARSEGDRDEVHLETQGLRRLVSDVVAMVEPLADEAGLGFRRSLPSEEIVFETDPEKIRQILVNLLTNAVKFTEEGEVRLEVERDGGELVFRVSDTGIGIDEENLERIFDAFSQVEEPRTRRVGGTGIGLNVVRNLVGILDGSVEVESEVGVGSTFTVRLPFRPGDPEEVE